jgi:NAD(P)-dependent dehydrogenase (short-subunit alcohol dehydrogenase family)
VGAAAAHEFARRGWHVVATGRSADKLAAVAASVRRETGRDVEWYQADFARLADVRRLAEQVSARHERIDVLANNAGLMVRRREVTEDGHELTWQANHLAPFLLTRLLWERLDEGSRVVTTTSEAHRGGRLDLTDPDYQRRRWSSWGSYFASKLANIVFTRELAARIADRGVVATCFHPGAVRSDFGRESLGFRLVQWFPKVFVTPRRAAARLLYLALDEAGTNSPGGYFVNNRLTAPRIRPADPDLGRALWDLSTVQTGG